MQILDGKVVATARREQIKSRVEQYRQGHGGKSPGLAVVLVGDDPASQVYVRNKLKACQEVGIQSFEHRVAADISATKLKALIQGLNQNPEVDGILLQLPLPPHLKAEEAIAWISPEKDADCMTAENLGRLWSGRPVTTPCTPWGVMVILEHYRLDVTGLNAVVVGRSNIVGKPMAHLLIQANATVTVCHSHTKNLRQHTRNADLVVVAAGRPEFLGAEDFKKGAIIIDVGIHRKIVDGKNKLVGDVRFHEIEKSAKAATPVPGGVGPMTITMLLENTLILAEKSQTPAPRD